MERQITFFLKDIHATKKTLVFVLVNWRGERIKKSTGLHTLPASWDKKLKRSVDDNELNEKLDYMETSIKDVLESNPNAYKLIDELSKMIAGQFKVKQSVKSFMGFIEEFTLDVKSQIGLSYYKSLNTTVNHLKKYEAKYGELKFDDIDAGFFRRFKAELMDLNLTKNTVGKNLLNVKRFMSEAVETGVTTNLKFKSRACRVSKESVNNIYLTIEELNKINAHKYSSPHLQRTADLLLIGAFTGMRFSDYSRLKAVNFYTDKTGSYVVQDMKKTSGRVIVPQHPIVKEVLARNNGVPPRAISNQKFNVYLKEVGREAGIDSETQRTRTEGYSKESTTFKKYELITSHTGRRSFATNAYLAGIPIASIMRLTGHRTMVQFFNYLKITEIEVSQSLSESSFFKPVEI